VALPCEWFCKIGILAVFVNFAAIKKTFSENLRACIIFVQDATFVPNLTFLGVLSPEISFEEKTISHPPRQPAYFAIREPREHYFTGFPLQNVSMLVHMLVQQGHRK